MSTGGYLFCLDPLTGEVRWNNPLKGYGASAPTALVSVRGQSSQVQGQQAVAADATTATVITTGVVVAASTS